MKKLSIPKILLASVSVVIMNSCSKSNDISTAGPTIDSTSIRTPLPRFELAYVITPFTSDIRSITFNDENGIPETVYDMASFPGGIKELKVSAHTFKAKIVVAVGNAANHPVGFRLEIKVNGQTRQIKDITLPSMTSYTTATAEYEVQFD